MNEDPNPAITELRVEAVRVIASGPDQTIIGFRFEDEADVENEASLFFTARAFAKPKRLFGTYGAVRDAHFDGKTLWAVDRHFVHRASRPFAKASRRMWRDHVHVNAIAGTSPKDVYAVGEGILHFDGKSWTNLDHAGAELHCAVAHGDVVYAAGAEGALVALEAGKARPIATKVKGDLEAIHVGASGILSVGGKGVALSGPPEKLKRVTLPKKAEVVVGVAELAGKTYWAIVGDHEGFGLFVQKGAELSLVDERIAGQLSSSGDYLFVAGDYGVLRYDGKEWKVLGLTWDEKKKRWNLVSGSLDDIDDGAD